MKPAQTVAVTATLACTLMLGCAQSSHTPSAKITVRQTTIQSELQSLTNHPWAGEYYWGDGLGANVTFAVAPQAGFAFVWRGCLGVYGQNLGSVSYTNNRVHLRFDKPRPAESFGNIGSEFIPVRWGPRQYLIDANEMIKFCSDVNSGSEPRERLHGHHLLRIGDEKKPTAGAPQVPPEFTKYLVTKPITATIVAIGKPTLRPSISDWNFREVPVTLDKGANDGLAEGMELNITTAEARPETVKLTRVDKQKSTGLITQIGEDGPLPQQGWKVSTRAPWNK